MPESLRQLIEQQLEQTSPEEQALLEATSVAGMTFSAATVAAALEQTAEGIEAQCEALIRRGQFIEARGTASWPDGTVAARYGFSHALYQEVLYDRVPESRRARLHREIGARLEVGYGPHAREIGVELAMHFERGHDPGRAVQYLQVAGDSALQRSAHREAVAHLTKGLAMLSTLADTPERAHQELRLLIALGEALVVTKGYASPEVADTYARARELCRDIGETPQLFYVLWGLWSFDLVRGQLQTARESAERCLSLAHRLEDPTLVLEARNMLGQTLSYLGAFPLAYTHAEQGFALYDAQQHHALASRYVRDPGVLCLFYKAWNLWFLGYPDRALTTGREADAGSTQV